MIYWTLIPQDFSDSIGSAYIKIYTDFRIPQSTDVWGYGNYGGTAYVYDGYIEMESDGALGKNEYMTILVKFPIGSFNLKNELDHSFDYYYKMAEKGANHYVNADKNDTGKSSMLSVIFDIIAAIFTIVMFVIIPIISIVFAAQAMSPTINFGPEGKKIPRDVAYYRDIPCNGDLFKAYYIGYQYGLLKNKTDVLGAIILKWIKEAKARVEQREAGGILKKQNIAIIFENLTSEDFETREEYQIFEMLYEASKDGILESKEFEKWCNRHYSKILNWFDKLLKVEKDKLVKEGLISYEQKKMIFKYNKYTATHELKEEAIKIAGLRRYLKEYTLIKDREAIEVAIFEEYLILAQLMGIAKEVSKEFKELYPHIIEESRFVSYDNIIFVNYYAHSGINKATTARQRANSYSGGGGGFSSGGGGGGSFGGRRRRWRFPLKID